MATHTSWSARDIPDQAGRVAVVTGANSGLGFEVAKALAGKNASVVLACRTLSKGEAACDLIRSEHQGAKVRAARLDIADMASVRAFAEQLRSREPRVDLLINNAGVMAIPRGVSADGFELQFATNHLGHFALAGLLLDRLMAAPRSRVVAVASIAAQSGTIRFDDLMGERSYTPWVAYNQSKLANLMFGLELQRRLSAVPGGTAMGALIAHPGASTTNLFSTPGAHFVKKIISPMMRFLFQPPARGALPLLYAATAEGAEPGGYYGPDGFKEMKGAPAIAKMPAAAQDRSVAARLWDVSEQLTGVRYLSQTSR